MQAFKKILIGFAFSPNLKANVYEALRMAFFFDAELTFVHVGEKTPEKETRFEGLLHSCTIQPKKISIHWKQGKPIQTLLFPTCDLSPAINIQSAPCSDGGANRLDCRAKL